MKKKSFNYFSVTVGILLLGAGFVLLKSVSSMVVLPYICIGLGCGAFGYGLGDLASERAVKNHPELQKQMEIEQKDERNIAVSNRAKAKAYDVMLYIFGALMVSFTLMGVDIFAILLLVFAYLFVIGFFIYSLRKYNREM